MDKIIWLAPVLSVVALLFAAYKAWYVSKAPAGNSRMQEIAAAIAEGANAFLTSEYKILAIFIVVLFALIALFIDLGTAVCFLARSSRSPPASSACVSRPAPTSARPTPRWRAV